MEGNGEKAVMKRDIEELEKKIDDLSTTFVTRFTKVEKFFDAGGICEKSRGKVDAVATQTKWQWGAITALTAGISAWLGYVTRIVIEHFQRGG